MNMMAGAFSFAKAKASRTSFAPSPMNICTSCGPASLRNVAFVCAAQALAKSVFPVPGGPYSRTPCKTGTVCQTCRAVEKHVVSTG